MAWWHWLILLPLLVMAVVVAGAGVLWLALLFMDGWDEWKRKQR